MRTIFKVILAVLFSIGLTILIASFIIDNYDTNCLENYARKVCINKQLDYKDYNVDGILKTNQIRCSENRDYEYQFFIFLESEINDCKTKNTFSFRKIK